MGGNAGISGRTGNYGKPDAPQKVRPSGSFFRVCSGWAINYPRVLMNTTSFRSISKCVSTFTLGALLLGARLAGAAEADTLALDPKGSSLKFFCESFLHNFHGEAREISGDASVSPELAPPIQKASLHFKLATMTTFIKDRDSKMYDWLHVKANPEAVFELKSVKLVSGDYKAADAQHPAQFHVVGQLTLNGVAQSLEGDAKGWRENDRLVVSGDAVVDTLKFGLPQIRMAVLTVGTNVKTSYTFSFVLPAIYAKQAANEHQS